MNLQELRDSGWIIFECLTGSHAYGTNVEGSDYDYRGVFIQPTHTLLGTKYYPQIGDEKNDTNFFEIGEFIKLLAKPSPNVLELLNMPDECVVYKHAIWDKIFTPEIKQKFITKKLRNAFAGYAVDQIKKARGLEKMMNWEEHRIERKDVLDFCYVLTEREQSINFKIWEGQEHKHHSSGWGPKQIRENIGLAKVNNFPDTYAAYYLETGGGIISDNSNDVQLRSIPKDAEFLFYMRFDKNAYSTHCKDYNKYQNWLTARNTQRYVDIEGHGQKIDGKNLLHTVRLLNTSKDIAEGRGIVIRRPEAEYLKDIRRGKYDLAEIIDKSEILLKEVDAAFETSGLPESIDPEFVNK